MVKTLTARGLMTTDPIAVLCTKTRDTSKSMQHPNSAWVVRQTKEFLAKTKDPEQPSSSCLARSEIHVVRHVDKSGGNAKHISGLHRVYPVNRILTS